MREVRDEIHPPSRVQCEAQGVPRRAGASAWNGVLRQLGMARQDGGRVSETIRNTSDLAKIDCSAGFFLGVLAANALIGAAFDPTLFQDTAGTQVQSAFDTGATHHRTYAVNRPLWRLRFRRCVQCLLAKKRIMIATARTKAVGINHAPMFDLLLVTGVKDNLVSSTTTPFEFLSRTSSI